MFSISLGHCGRRSASQAYPRQPYRRLLDMMARDTLADGYHRLLTTNWDHLLQRELLAWMKENNGGYPPKSLATHGTAYHLNGSVEPGDGQNRSPFMLETDDAGMRVRAHEAKKVSTGSWTRGWSSSWACLLSATPTEDSWARFAGTRTTCRSVARTLLSSILMNDRCARPAKSSHTVFRAPVA